MRACQLLESSQQPNMGEIFEKFFPIAMRVIGLTTLPKIHLEAQINDTHQPTFGRFVNDSAEIHLAIKNRHPLDVLRTLAHELVHYKQKLDDRLTPDSGKTGSPEENQAHELAGIIMRQFNKKYPTYFQQPSITLKESNSVNEMKLSLMGKTYPLEMDKDLSTPGRSEYYDFETDRGRYKISLTVSPFNSKKFGRIKYLKIYFMSKMQRDKDDREHFYTGETKVDEPIDSLNKIARTIIDLTKEKIFDDDEIEMIDFRIPAPDLESKKLERIIRKLVESNIDSLFSGWVMDSDDAYLYKEQGIIGKFKRTKDRLVSKKLDESKKRVRKFYENFTNLDEGKFSWVIPLEKEFGITRAEANGVGRFLSLIYTKIKGTNYPNKESFTPEAILKSFLSQSDSHDIVDYVIKDLENTTITGTPKDKQAAYSENNPIVFSAKGRRAIVRKNKTSLDDTPVPDQEKIANVKPVPESYPWEANLKYCFPNQNVTKLADNLSVIYKKLPTPMSQDDFIISFFVSENPDKVISDINSSDLVVRYKSSGDFYAGPRKGRPPISKS